MTKPFETITVHESTVGCDGSGRGANITQDLGHPLVYLTIAKNGMVDCPYCGRRYVLSTGAKAAAH